MPVTVRLEPELVARLDRAANRRGLTRSDLVRDALSRVLDEDEAAETYSFYDEVVPLVGCVDSGGAGLSEQTGQRFRELLEKRRERRPG